MILRPRSAQIHSKKNLPPVSHHMPRPGSSQSTLRRRGNNHRGSLGSSLTRSSARKNNKNFTFRNNMKTLTRGLEANLSGAFNNLSANNRMTKNRALAQSAAQMQADHLHHSAALHSLDVVASTPTPNTDSGNTTQRSSDSEEDRNTARSSEESTTAAVAAAAADAASSMAASARLLLPATAALSNIIPATHTNPTTNTVSSLLGASTNPSLTTGVPTTSGTNPNPTTNTVSSLLGASTNPSLTTGTPNTGDPSLLAPPTLLHTTITPNASTSSIRMAASRKHARPMTTQNPESRRRRTRQDMRQQHQHQHQHQQQQHPHNTFNTQRFAMSNMQANHRRPGTAPEKLHRSQHVMMGGSNSANHLGSDSSNMTEDEIRNENSKLRQQMEKMRMDSFHKIRSGKRFSSGGGFRVSKNRATTPVEGTKSKNKYLNEIQHLKNTIRTLTSDKQNVESELADANMRLNRCIQNQKNLFNQVKTIENDRDRLKETINVRERLISDQSHRLDEQEKQLEMSLGRQRAQSEEIARLQDELRKMAEDMAAALNGSPQRSKRMDLDSIQQLKDELCACQQKLLATEAKATAALAQVSELEANVQQKHKELTTINTKWVETRQKNQQLKDQLNKHQQGTNELNKKYQKALNELATLKTTNQALKTSNQEKDVEIQQLKLLNKDNSQCNALNEEIKALHKKIKDMESAAQARLLALQQHIAQLETEAGQMELRIVTVTKKGEASEERANQAEGTVNVLQDELNRLKLLVETLEAQLASKNKELQRLRASGKEKHSQQGDLETRCKTLQMKLNKSLQEVQGLRNQMDEQLNRCREAETLARTTQKGMKMVQKELRVMETDLNDEQVISEQLRKQLSDCMKQMAGFKQAMKTACHKARKEALESSLQSMVRLCVVAPTVNVHFNSQQQQCKAPMPSSRIQNIIENQVLPNFSELFIQLEEGTAENGEKLDTWLEGMLGEMQKSIQSHLADVFTEQGKQGGQGGQSGQSGGSSSSSSRRPRSRR